MIEQGATAEWLQAMVGDDDYEPSGLVTPDDRVELARRQAKRLQGHPGCARTGGG